MRRPESAKAGCNAGRRRGCGPASSQGSRSRLPHRPGARGEAAGVRLPKADETGHGPGGRKSRAMQAFLTMLLPREQQVEESNVSGAIRP